MDTQGWWEELVAQLADPQPNRAVVLECLRKLLEALAEGDPLPHVNEEDE
jgi:hypothetical protein